MTLVRSPWRSPTAPPRLPTAPLLEMSNCTPLNLSTELPWISKPTATFLDLRLHPVEIPRNSKCTTQVISQFYCPLSVSNLIPSRVGCAHRAVIRACPWSVCHTAFQVSPSLSLFPRLFLHRLPLCLRPPGVHLKATGMWVAFGVHVRFNFTCSSVFLGSWFGGDSPAHKIVFVQKMLGVLCRHLF